MEKTDTPELRDFSKPILAVGREFCTAKGPPTIMHSNPFARVTKK
jgi:hypothetical protein